MPLPYAQAVPGKKYNSYFSAVMHPLSRGTVHLASSDPLAAPAIDPNYFANEADLDVVVHTIEVVLKLNATSALSTQVVGIHSPTKEVIAKGKEGLKEYARANCWPVYHPVGTASMLPKEDGGVVDASLKVYGTSNLRVVSTDFSREVEGSLRAASRSTFQFCPWYILLYLVSERLNILFRKFQDILKHWHMPSVKRFANPSHHLY